MTDQSYVVFREDGSQIQVRMNYDSQGRPAQPKESKKPKAADAAKNHQFAEKSS